MAPTSRWADNDEDRAYQAKLRADKEAKKRAKAEKQRQAEAADKRSYQTAADRGQAHGVPPGKRRRLTPQNESQSTSGSIKRADLLQFPSESWGPCRHVDNFEKLNHIEEGSYGWVSRAKETATGEIVALKKLKMDYNGNEGFPVTGLREIETLQASRHPNIVTLREVVMGDSSNDVFLVMDFVEHDLRTLAESMSEPFSLSETKALLQQLASAVDYLHSNWILHRDLKTSNLLMSNRGEIKLADFGMARYYGDPPPKLTQLVVTLWYRPPELILGADSYGAEVDMWSVGCIFGELLINEPLLQGKNEVDQLTKIFELRGIPDESSWPGFRRLPNARSLRLPTSKRAASSSLRTRFPHLTTAGCSLLESLLSMNPNRRPNAAEMLKHPYFGEDPKPKSQAMFPTFPSKAGQERRRKLASPSAPVRGAAPTIGGRDADFSDIFAGRDTEESGAGFRLRMV